MTLDWSKIGSGKQEPLLRPRDIYAALPHKPWPYLRQEQGEVLEGWFGRRDCRDVVIKQNTGGGKTVVGLLIAQSTINEGIGKAVYLAPDTYLAGRVRQEASRLGLAVVDDVDDSDFHARQAILVTTFQTLINGKSRFGVVGDGKTPINLGVVVIDDAHAALAITEGQFRLTVPRTHPAYQRLLDLFEADLKQQSTKVWEDIRDSDYTAVQRIPYWAWADKHDKVMEILHPHRKEEPFKFEWPLISGSLRVCTAMVTFRGIEMRPPAPAVDMIPSFTNAQRRVYLTATLADDSILVTDLGADPSLLTTAVTPGSAADLGERMVLSPVALNPKLDDDAVRQLAQQFSMGDRNGDGQPECRPINVVVLVPSDRVADPWKAYAEGVYHVGDLAELVGRLSAGHVGLVVLVNKYDGVDLPRQACELLVIDGVPQPLDGLERRESAALNSSPARRIREVQPIEQGMGRGVRDSEDYCAVLLLGNKLALATRDPEWLTLFSPATRAQLALSNDVAAQIKGHGLDAVREVLSLCLDRDTNWIERSRRTLADVRYASAGIVRTEAIAMREAFDLANTGQPTPAATRLQQAINQVDDPLLRGLLREQKATYLHLSDPAVAQQQQGEAARENPHLLRPVIAVDAPKFGVIAAQAATAAQFLAQTYTEGTQLVLGVRALLDDIDWDENRTEQAEAAWKLLGSHLGFVSIRPEQAEGKGPDNLWGLSGDRHGVFELKTGATTDFIAKKDVDQLGGSLRWNQERNPDVKSAPVMLHQSRVLAYQAAAVPGMRVITPGALDTLKTAVRAYAVALADGQGRWSNEQAVADQLRHAKLTGTAIISAFSDEALATK